MTKGKRLLSLITGLALAISILQSAGVSAKASAMEVGWLELRSSIPEAIHDGDNVYSSYAFATCDNTKVEFTPIGWCTFTDGHYVKYESQVFGTGQYYYLESLHLSESNYIFSEFPDISVNGDVWSSTTEEASDQGTITIISPAYTVPYGYGTFEIDLSDGNPRSFHGDDGVKINAFFAAAIKEKRMVRVSNQIYTVDGDNTGDIKITMGDGNVGDITVCALPGASQKGAFAMSVKDSTLHNLGYTSYSRLVINMPGGDTEVSPLDMGTLVIDLSKGDISLSGNKLEAFKTTIKMCERSTSTSDSGSLLTNEVIDLNGDSRYDIMLSIAPSENSAYGEYCCCLSMHQNCSSFTGNKYVLALNALEIQEARSYESPYFSRILFTRPKKMNVHNLGNFAIDMRGNRSVELTGDNAAFFLASILSGNVYSEYNATVHRTDLSNTRNESVINLDLDYYQALNGDDVVLRVTKYPSLTVKITPLSTRTIPYSVVTELSSNTKNYYTNRIRHAFYSPITFIFADVPVVEPDPPKPDDKSNKDKKDDQKKESGSEDTSKKNDSSGNSSSQGSGSTPAPSPTPAPTVNTAPATRGVGEVVSNNGAIYIITSTIEGQQEVTYKKSDSNTATSSNIPESIAIDGKSYSVTEIAPGAFKNNKKLKKVTIGKNIRKIGSKAFFKCKNLKNIKVKTTYLKKSSVGGSAFKGIHPKAKAKVPRKKLKSYQKILKARGINGKEQKITK